MISRFCDICGERLLERNTPKGGINNRRVGTKIYNPDNSASLSVEIIAYKNNTANDGDFCIYCIIDALNKLDDRVKQSIFEELPDVASEKIPESLR